MIELVRIPNPNVAYYAEVMVGGIYSGYVSRKVMSKKYDCTFNYQTLVKQTVDTLDEVKTFFTSQKNKMRR